MAAHRVPLLWSSWGWVVITSEPNTYPHCSVVVHSSSPTNPDGSYNFEPAWRYLYGVAELSP